MTSICGDRMPLNNASERPATALSQRAAGGRNIIAFAARRWGVPGLLNSHVMRTRLSGF